ncbi:hypothetical protein [Halopolyspora algeriensis]|uniref:hypothetical protein n=1 Tax=Halopolyspora algeriensis TaxID=1500506 RepID=UPI001152F3CC|nr:hypothetical protein [Halopolyspora algeriensis]
MTSRAARLAVLLRRAQWELDDVAHALPEGRVSGAQCRTLAEGLEQLAGALRDHAADTSESAGVRSH